MQRALYLRQVQGMSEKSFKLYPVWKWTTTDVIAFLRVKRIPLPPRLCKLDAADQRGTAGFGLDINSLLFIHDHYPEDFHEISRFFPYVGAVIERERIKASQGAKLRDGESPQEQAQRSSVQPQDHR